MISSERARELFDYDPASGILRWKNPAANQSRRIGTIAGWKQGKKYLQVVIGNNKYLVHRLIWLMTYGKWPAHQIDHINGVRDDNRLANLRQATNSQNTCNSRVRSDSASGFKGVAKRKNKWIARIYVGGRGKSLGYYETAQEAHAAYCKAASAAYGEFMKAG